MVLTLVHMPSITLSHEQIRKRPCLRMTAMITEAILGRGRKPPKGFGANPPEGIARCNLSPMHPTMSPRQMPLKRTPPERMSLHMHNEVDSARTASARDASAEDASAEDKRRPPRRVSARHGRQRAEGVASWNQACFDNADVVVVVVIGVPICCNDARPTHGSLFVCVKGTLEVRCL